MRECKSPAGYPTILHTTSANLTLSSTVPDPLAPPFFGCALKPSPTISDPTTSRSSPNQPRATLNNRFLVTGRHSEESPIDTHTGTEVLLCRLHFRARANRHYLLALLVANLLGRARKFRWLAEQGPPGLVYHLLRLPQDEATLAQQSTDRERLLAVLLTAGEHAGRAEGDFFVSIRQSKCALSLFSFSLSLPLFFLFLFLSFSFSFPLCLYTSR